MVSKILIVCCIHHFVEKYPTCLTFLENSFHTFFILIQLGIGKDQGINIRHKVSDMIEFIQDDDRLRDERKKAKKNKDKYVGMSSDSMGFRGSGFDSGWQDKWPNSGKLL